YPGQKEKLPGISSCLRAFVATALTLTMWGCGQDKGVTFARLLERAASWGSSLAFAQELAQQGLVPRHYVEDLMATASQELTALAALAGDAARMHGTPTQSSVRELELQLRASAQQARAVDDAR